MYFHLNSCQKIILEMFNLGYTQEALSVPNEIIGVLNRSAILNCKVNFTGLNETNPNLKSFFIEEVTTSSQIAYGTQTTLTELNGGHSFVGRLKAEYIGAEDTYRLTINNVQFTDEQVLESVLVYSIENDNSKIRTKRKFTKLTVKGKVIFNIFITNYSG